MKTSLIVLNLTIAGLLQTEVAAAEETVASSNDEPRSRASPDEPRFRLGIEQTIATFQRMTVPKIGLRRNPSSGAAALGPAVSLVPRMGIQYIYETTRLDTSQFDDSGRAQFVSLTPGLVVDFWPASCLFVGTGAEADFRVHSAFGGDLSPLYVESLASRWSWTGW
jgi:hypothetical protein